ncbi:MAG: type II toxin-antitoxin system VapC family toxin [Nitrospirota bacterium]
MLLDTHIFLWWITDDSRLIANVRDIIADGTNDLFLSVASCWEIAIKAQLGSIDLPDKPDKFIAEQLSLNAIMSLPILANHALNVFNIPSLHRDPFDRLIISQAITEKLPIVTSDPVFRQYGIETVWK